MTTLFKDIFSSWLMRVAGFVLLAVVFVAIFANLILPVSPYAQDISHVLASPSRG